MKLPKIAPALPARGLEKHPRSTAATLGFVATLLAGLASCWSGGSRGGAGGGETALDGSTGTGGGALAGAAGSPRDGNGGGGGASGSSAAGSGGGRAEGTGGANPTGGGGGGGTAGTKGDAGSGSGGAWGVVALEAVSVPAGAALAMSNISLDSGALFLLKAVGVLKAGTGADGDMDAEYGGITAAGAGQDMVAGVDVGVDVGFKVERAPAGTSPGRKKWFGPYRSDHTYDVIVTGAGAPLSLKTIQPPSSTATGAITVSIFRLSPTPTSVVLDSFNVPVTNRLVHSTMTTARSTVYLLKVAGSGKVGGNNLGLGDADWMDWAANGNGKVDVGDGNVDYGLGVDEFNTAMSPRLRWWGPWRQDHTYYMLFGGTGNTIGFMYYDIGYGDNSVTDMLAVQVLAPP